MLICSDGIWEFISKEEAMEIGNKFIFKWSIRIYSKILKYKLSNIYSEVEENIWYPKEEQKAFPPRKFTELWILSLPKLLLNAKDLLIYLMEQIHKELNESKENNNTLLIPRKSLDETKYTKLFYSFEESENSKFIWWFRHWYRKRKTG